jgi:uncharacterized repeat protein (TIGR03803 family)
MSRVFEVFSHLKRGKFLLLSAAAAVSLSAQPAILHSLANTDGANPFAGLLQAKDGNFYGTTYGGGTNGGSGVVFQITPGGTYNDIYNFCSQTNCTDGALAVGKLVQGKDGNLYGTTASGGANNRGTVFSITTGGTYHVLYSFCNQTGCTDGAQPYAGLIQGKDENLYGTTKFGGANSWGSIFEIGTSGGLTTLYSFCPQTGCADGARPNAPLIQATNGDFYGTTLEGGANNNNGTVFQFTGGTLTTLYSFCAQANCADGSSPVAPLIQASNLDLYGTTEYGGANNNNGTVFQITTGGAFNSLYSFCAQASCADGQGATGGLVQATDGNLYGTTDAGGIGYGTIYKITTGGTLTSLYSFPNEGAGSEPYAGLIQATNGEFYGTTFIGGANGYGEIYSFTVQVAVPDVVGLTQAAATTSITGVGLVVGTVSMESSSSVPSGEVISQNPVAPTEVNLGSAVDLVISTGEMMPTISMSVTPNSGSGTGPTTFSAQYTDSDGVSDLQVVYLDFGSTAFDKNDCIAAYVPGTNQLYLYTNNNSGTLGPITLGSGGSISNSQCTLFGGSTKATTSGDTLTVPFQIQFLAGYDGLKQMWMLAQSFYHGGTQSNGGVPNDEGTWTPAASTPGVGTVTPNSGSGTSQIFSVTYTDSGGANDLQVVYLDIASVGSAPHNCEVAYLPGSNTLYLFTDNNSSAVGPIAEGAGGGILSNSQCTLSSGTTAATMSGTSLTVPFNITFKTGYAGKKTLFGLSQTYAGTQSSGGALSTLGSWTPAASTPSVGTITPDNGTGLEATAYTVTFTDTGGANDLQAIYVTFGSALNAANSCAVGYIPGLNQLFLLNDNANGFSTLGEGGGGSVSNNQCTLSGGSTAATLTGTGNPSTLNVPLNITFKSGYTGLKTIWGLAQTYAGTQSNSGVPTNIGTWNP